MDEWMDGSMVVSAAGLRSCGCQRFTLASIRLFVPVDIILIILSSPGWILEYAMDFKMRCVPSYSYRRATAYVFPSLAFVWIPLKCTAES